ncbi:LytTR family DNA-binding domain-containing protein [Acidobacterium sp. S8]|uniref:LytR/AlgR family response regulator transcription factor n=1 Tax=Acidobacterium sp. S8 TaxID=1641854 RepID=UPI00131D2D60|nr:LytTR family DNA-binding domain-containing protein [Acidobacterium sp. S8]
MKSLRVLVVDDEPAIRGGIRKLLTTMDDVVVAGECQNAAEAVTAIRRNSIDLVLLDIHLPDASGLDVVRSVGTERMPLVVFVTAYDEHAIEAFELNALDYLLKPFDEERLERALDRARERLTTDGQQQVVQQLQKLLANYTQAGPERFVIRKTNHYEFVSADAIDWIESADNYVELHCGGKTHLLNETMGGIEQRLDPQKFLRIHRRHIVNTSRILAVHPLAGGTYEIELQHGARLTSGRNFTQAVRLLIGR